MSRTQTVGILAYGSLIGDPGDEIKEVRSRTIEGVITPFAVEFARSSNSRGGAPTLVPYDGGGCVCAQIFVLDTAIEDACDRLYRREIHAVGSGKPYVHKDKPGPKDVVIEQLESEPGIDIVLYTKIAVTIDDPSAQRLAQLAIDSVAGAKEGEDGISYLMNAVKCGIRTPLTDAYVAEILQRMGAGDLAAALEKERAKVKGS